MSNENLYTDILYKIYIVKEITILKDLPVGSINLNLENFISIVSSLVYIHYINLLNIVLEVDHTS